MSVVFVGTQWCQQVALAQEAELRERAADCSSGPKNDLMIRAADTEGAGILGLVRGCWLVVPGAYDDGARFTGRESPSPAVCATQQLRCLHPGTTHLGSGGALRQGPVTRRRAWRAAENGRSDGAGKAVKAPTEWIAAAMMIRRRGGFDLLMVPVILTPVIRATRFLFDQSGRAEPWKSWLKLSSGDGRAQARKGRVSC